MNTPSPDDIVNGLTVCGWYDGFGVDETNQEGDGELFCYGETDDGTRFSFTLKVLTVQVES